MQSENVNKSQLYYGSLLKKFRIESYLVPKNSFRGGAT